MNARLARWLSLLQRTPPEQAESLVRSLLIQYFFHTFNKAMVEVTGLAAGAAPRLNLLLPTVFNGGGRVRVAATALLGWGNSPFSHRASYIEARNAGALIEIGEKTTINNAAVLIAEGAGIRIGARCLIGTDFQLMDTYAHELELGRRHEADSRTRQVVAGDDVFIGSRVTLLKGCRLGDGCVVASGAVVAPGFEAPAMSIVAGNPARVVGQMPTPATADGRRHAGRYPKTGFTRDTTSSQSQLDEAECGKSPREYFNQSGAHRVQE